MSLQQDSIRTVQQQPASTPISLMLPVSKPQLDLDRAQELMEQVTEREEKMFRQQMSVTQHVRKPKQPSVEIHPLMRPYRDMGCRLPVYFPDTIRLTALEQYYYLPIDQLPATTDSAVVTAPAIAETFADSIPQAADTIPQAPVVAAKPTVSRPATTARPDKYPDASVTLSLMAALLLFTWFKYRFGRNLRWSFLAFFNYRQSCRMQEESRESDRRAALCANLFCCLVAGIFITLLLSVFGREQWESKSLSIVVFSVAVAVTIRVNVFLWTVIGHIFLFQSVARDYAYNVLLCSRVTGIVIFPFVLLIPFVAGWFAHIPVYAALAVAGGIYLLRLFRFFQIIHAKKVPAFYFILYLCTLEILPFCLLAKACKFL
ncbi:MAG: DUF4271 domain-containing protein [Bacteroidales bacterium]|jgi:hypothetical protein|nr:DUF4271 domain-containing protein [Bacteroidales bacterium]